MWMLWIKEGNKWIGSTKQYVEESDARAKAKELKEIFSLDQVFVQYGEDSAEEIRNQIMYNCHKIFRFNRLFAITHTLAQAEYILRCIAEYESKHSEADYRIECAFIEGIGF